VIYFGSIFNQIIGKEKNLLTHNVVENINASLQSDRCWPENRSEIFEGAKNSIAFINIFEQTRPIMFNFEFKLS